MTPFVPEMGKASAARWGILRTPSLPSFNPYTVGGCSRARTDLKMPMGCLIIEPPFLTCARVLVGKCLPMKAGNSCFVQYSGIAERIPEPDISHACARVLLTKLCCS